MSGEQMIAELESQKLAYIHKVDLAIRNLRDVQQQPGSDDLRRRVLDFEPIEIQGEPLSHTIIRDRGPY